MMRGMTTTARSVGEFYDDAGMDWSLRSVGPHLHPGSEEATVFLARLAARYGMSTGGWILDVASALGAPARFVARKFGSRVVCADMDRRMHSAATAANRHEGLTRALHPVLARTERLPLAKGSCDGAWSQDALCHMDKGKVLSEVARVLKPGSVFAFSDFVGRGSLTPDDRDALKSLWAFPNLYDLATYVAELTEYGFEVLHAEDRTEPVLRARPRGMPDDELWWHEFSSRWGEAEANARLEAGQAWQAIVQGGRAGYAAFVARRLVDDW